MTAELGSELIGACAGLAVIFSAYLLGTYLEWRRGR